MRPEHITSDRTYLIQFIEDLIINEFNLKKDQRHHLAEMVLEAVSSEVDAEKFERMASVVVSKLLEAHPGEVKKLVYTKIVENFN